MSRADHPDRDGYEKERRGVGKKKKKMKEKNWSLIDQSLNLFLNFFGQRRGSSYHLSLGDKFPIERAVLRRKAPPPNPRGSGKLSFIFVLMINRKFTDQSNFILYLFIFLLLSVVSFVHPPQAVTRTLVRPTTTEASWKSGFWSIGGRKMRSWGKASCKKRWQIPSAGHT